MRERRHTIVVNQECHTSEVGSADCLLMSNSALGLGQCSLERQTLARRSRTTPKSR